MASATNSRALTEDIWDLYLDGDNRIARVEDKERVRQNIRERLQFFLGEWFLDIRVGVPWFQEIFVKPANLALTESELKRAIIQTKFVNELLEFEFLADIPNRFIEIPNFAVDTTFGRISGGA